MGMLRHRRDVPAGDPVVASAAMRHVRDHLASLVAPDDDPRANAARVWVWVEPHPEGDPELVSVVGQVDAQPHAPYLAADYDPAADHPEVVFRPFELIGQSIDHTAWQRHQQGQAG